ncbi:MAG: helix-turn-helix domain-containing protein, partial [Chloroflexota bacterium]|nr:helix-turn-helix domain-containing protein [Chloroflexota bacterium]
PFARVDEVAAEALGITLRALLRRPPPAPPPPPARAPEPNDVWSATLLAVARTNGRVAPAARALGVHRNTVLYRLRAARAAHGIDPRRPEDALRILRESES